MILEGSTDIRHVSLLLGKDLVDESEEYSNPVWLSPVPFVMFT